MNELIEAYLNGNEETSYMYNRVTKEVHIADEAAKSNDEFVFIPQMTAPEAHHLMEEFANNQEETIAKHLLEALNGKKPFRSFKDGIKGRAIENEWYHFENEYATSKMNEWVKQYE